MELARLLSDSAKFDHDSKNYITWSSHDEVWDELHFARPNVDNIADDAGRIDNIDNADNATANPQQTPHETVA